MNEYAEIERLKRMLIAGAPLILTNDLAAFNQAVIAAVGELRVDLEASRRAYTKLYDDHHTLKRSLASEGQK